MSEFYRLDSFENNKFEPIKPVSQEEFNKVKDSIKSITEFNQQFLIYIYFQLNLIEFDKLINALSNIPVTQLDINALQSKNQYININRVIFNLLASFKFFIDSSEAYIKRKFGKKSTEINEFIEKTKYSFDNSFAYRFLSKLRHYSQHIGFPIHLFPFFANEDMKSPEKMKGNIKLVVELEILKKEKELFGRIVYNDLMELTTDIDIKPLIYELGDIIFSMEELIYNFHMLELENSIKYLESIGKEYKTMDNQLVIIYDIKSDNKYFNFSTLLLPFDEIVDIKNFKNWNN